MPQPALESELAQSLEQARLRGLDRQLEPPTGGADFSSNDYLGLARHAEVIEAAARAAHRFGVGARASRLLGGGSPLDRELEREVADWLGAEDALLFPTGYQANLGVVTTLAGRGDAVIADQRVHASLVDAARLSRARVRVFAHDDCQALEEALRESADARRRVVLVESIYSMDGDRASLAEVARLCERHAASLVVDEAHAIGLIGSREREGAGGWCLAAEQGAPSGVLAARVVTGGKALGVAGALVVGSMRLRAELLARARSFVFSTGTSPMVAGALHHAARLARAATSARETALGHARRIAGALELEPPAAAIVPWVVGDNQAAVDQARDLQRAGYDLRAVRPPTVPAGTARLRIACHAGNSQQEVEGLIGCLRERDRSRGSQGATIDVRAPRKQLTVVVGTDTGVGKTIVSALLVHAALRRFSVEYWKPVQTGEDCDTSEVCRLTADRCLTLHEPQHRFALPASPHEAAAAEGREVSIEGLDARLEKLLRAASTEASPNPASSNATQLIVELAGGLLVPLTPNVTQADWLCERRPATVLVARSGLGTLNHTLLTLEAMRSRGLSPRALILVGPPHPSNRVTLTQCSRVPYVFELPPLDPLDSANLAEVAAELDLDRLLGA